MAFKSSKGRDVGKEVKTWQSSEIGQGVGGVGGGDAGAPAPIGVGGSITMDEIDYENSVRTIVHVFDSPGTFSLSQAVTNGEYLAVGGGGGGGGGQRPEKGGGGGGAGGTVNAFLPGLGANTYTVTVGTAGTGGTGAPAQGTANPGYDGADTVFTGPDVTITMQGGGYGGAANGPPGNAGGSGGGGGGGPRPGGPAPGYPGTNQQGFPGAPGRGTPEYYGGGGGGARKGGNLSSSGDGIGVDWIPLTYGANAPTSFNTNRNPDNYIIYNQSTFGQHENGGVGISSTRFFGGGGGGGQGAAGGGGNGVGSNIPTTGGGGRGGPGPGGGTGGDGQPGFFAIKITYDFPT